MLKVGTDGKWDVATDASRYELHDIMDDNGHKLIVIRKLMREKLNALVESATTVHMKDKGSRPD